MASKVPVRSSRERNFIHSRPALFLTGTLLQAMARPSMRTRSPTFPAICRALVNDPKVLFADEPTGNLDSKNGAGILDLLRDLHRERQTTLVMVTHADEIADMAERVLTLSDGQLVSDVRQTQLQPQP